MNIIKVTTINEDGSVGAEVVFGPNEVRYTLELGMNFILQNGAAAIEAEEDDEDDIFEVDGSETVQ